jgi:hypothetical protein
LFSVKNQEFQTMLTAKRVERIKTPGRYSDGLVKGLLLQISGGGAKSWILRYERHGRERMMGLGSAADFNLKEARERARSARQLLADGIDPLEHKHAARAAAMLLPSGSSSAKQLSAISIKTNAAGGMLTTAINFSTRCGHMPSLPSATWT